MQATGLCGTAEEQELEGEQPKGFARVSRCHESLSLFPTCKGKGYFLIVGTSLMNVKVISNDLNPCFRS